MPVLLGAGVAVLVLAGCAPGDARSAAPFPLRPVDIDTTSIDLCETLRSDQLEALGVGPGEADASDLPSGPSRACMWSNYENGYNYTVQTIGGSAAAAIGAPATVVDPVDGFGAVRATAHRTSAPLCELYLDVADDQTLRIQVQSTASSSSASAQSLDDVCAEATSAASGVLQNLRRDAN